MLRLRDHKQRVVLVVMLIPSGDAWSGPHDSEEQEIQRLLDQQDLPTSLHFDVQEFDRQLFRNRVLFDAQEFDRQRFRNGELPTGLHFDPQEFDLRNSDGSIFRLRDQPTRSEGSAQFDEFLRNHGIDIEGLDYESLEPQDKHILGVYMRQFDLNREPPDWIQQVGGEPAVTPPIVPAPLGGEGSGYIHPRTGAYIPVGCAYETPPGLLLSRRICASSGAPDDLKATIGILAELRREWNAYIRIPESATGLDTCTGVLVAHNRVLTAAHCGPAAVQRGVQIGGSKTEWSRPSNHFDVARCVPHPESLRGGVAETDGCGKGIYKSAHDLAILELTRPVPARLARPKAPLLDAGASGFSRLQDGADLLMFGFGFTSTTTEVKNCEAISVDEIAAPEERQVMRAVLHAGADEARLELRVDVRTAKGKVGDSPFYGAVCGDSGGPVIIPASVGEPEVLVGIVGRGNSVDGKNRAASLREASNLNFLRLHLAPSTP